MKETRYQYIQTVRTLPKTLIALGILTLVYLLLAATLPPNTPTVQTYNLSTGEYHILSLLVGIPAIAVWFAAFYGYARLEEYVAIVGKATDGAPFAKIASGLKVLAWGLPVVSIVTNILGGIVHAYAGLASASFIIIHYLSLLISVVAFAYISSGSHGLIELTQARPTLTVSRWLLLALTVLGVVFSYFTITAAQAQWPNSYHLPIWLVLLTILIPYLFAWFMGLIAAYEIYQYSRRAKGLLYRRALAYVAVGILITILVSIMLQYIQSDTTRLRRITFNWVFLGIYALLLMYAAGFGLISAGVKKLRKIEEV